ncbi:acetoacetate--CoA ligase [Microbulbifer thermotolerans]|uniref:acetoacetate--CoA ligase n=1 Tax=Microbulbifer thermotolerans TaxID=252514 RepID=UPI002248C929|nr:acetoacetate--CoA ligase [Microbulbifer thermotolerans]MCX2781167.1 acetoacetate--CoA ligase [Microbulbifer thermotolerans]MCX2796323.1 acetoacetate--CoA ligase [Microbulbifer thermotolerans]MCX2806570.1 acetoacetate--CoA ligase [Microbulbifer thermotolerans]
MNNNNVQPLWRPTEQAIAATQMDQFRRRTNERHGLSLADYSELYRWSVDKREAFWSDLWDFAGVIASQRGERALARDTMPGAEWFPDARLNFAENLLRYRDERIALVERLENGRRRQLTYAELYRRVERLAAALVAQGVERGDRVAGFMPNIIDTVVAMLATTSLGAIWTSCSPDFGINGVLDRFGQVQPKVLFACEGYFYNGKTIDSLPRLTEIVARIDSIERMVVVPVARSLEDTAAAVGTLEKAVTLDAFVDAAPERALTFTQTEFNHPLYIMYSSGTTGVPKCIVHGAGGTLLQHLKEHRLHCDLKREDTLFYFTTCGWMMWNWLVSGLASGATLVLFDGSPFYPAAESLWDMVDEEHISIFGTSAKYIAALEKSGSKPRETHRLEKLRAVLSTGSPLAHEGFRYVYRDIKADLCLSSISGGTDIISCFALGNPTLPVYAGELQCRGLGMAVEVWDDDGRPVVGEKGELVCTKSFPCMPIGFWNDEDGCKYRSAYFDNWPGVWAHGDYAEITEHEGVVIYGRSDAVLNPGGVRIGTAEIYRQVEKVEEVLDSICIGQEWKGDVRVVLFVVLREGIELNDDLVQKIRSTIRANTTPRHVPAKVVQVADIPRTISGKIVELAVRNVVHGKPVKNVEALANPEALKLYENLPALMED